jgi:hypothetical protein
MRTLGAVWVAVWVWLVPVPPAQAQGWAGQDDAALVAARDLWLGGTDDMAVLQALAALAQGGNVAAQVMLGTLVAEARVPPAVGALPRAERIALTRAPGGLSGTSWLTVAAGADPVAAALEVAGPRWQQSSPDQQIAALEALLAAGEAGAAHRLLSTFGNMGGYGPTGGWTLVLAHGAHPALQGHGVPLLAMVRDVATRPEGGYADPEIARRAEAALAGADPGDLALADAGWRQTTLADPGLVRMGAEALVAGAPLAAPLAGVCATACPDGVAACTFALVMGTGGRPGFVTLSPFEGLVTSAAYQASPRFAADLRAALQQAAPNIARFDACAAAAIGG